MRAPRAVALLVVFLLILLNLTPSAILQPGFGFARRSTAHDLDVVVVAHAATALDVVAACARGVPAAPAARSAARAVIVMPMHAWWRLRVLAGSGLARSECASSRWRLREALRLHLGSVALAPAESQATGGYLIGVLPLDAGDALDAVVDAGAACALVDLAGAESRTRPRVAPLNLSAAAVAVALCGAPGARVPPRANWSRLALPRTLASGEGLVGVQRTCTFGAARAAPSAVWSLLLDGTLPDGARLPGSQAIACGATHPGGAAVPRSLAANYRAAHGAAAVSSLHRRRVLAEGILNQVPSIPHLPLLHGNTAALAAAAAAGDASQMLALLLPGALGADLPGTVTSFNVMVSPLGVLTALRGATVDAVAEGAGAAAPTATDAFLTSQFEVPLPPFGQAVGSAGSRRHENVSAERAAASERYIERALGGAAAVAALRRRSPRLRFAHYWPEGGGDDDGLDESAVAAPHGGSATLSVTNLATPAGDGVAAPHAAHVAWDDDDAARRGRPAALLVDEVVVLTPASDAYYWLTVDVVGRLALLAPYLAANPAVRVHVPYWYLQRWRGRHHAAAWLDALGLSGRLISGRVIARIAHLPDRQPVGPRQHALQLLAVRDAGLAVAAGGGLHRLLGAAEQPRDCSDACRDSVAPASNGRRRAVATHLNCTVALPPAIAAAQAPRDNVLLVQRRSSRRLLHLETLVTALRARGLDVVVFESPNDTPFNETLRMWTSPRAVVAAHGAGLTNALLLAPGTLLIEALPKGHAAAGQYYLQVAHYARLEHHVMVVPGLQSSTVALDSATVVRLVCAAARCTAATDAPPTPLPIATAPPLPGGGAWGTVPATARASLPPLLLGDSEPLLVQLDGDRVMPPPLVAVSPRTLPPANATGGLALLLIGTRQGSVGSSAWLRPLVRALERDGILPVVMGLGGAPPANVSVAAWSCQWLAAAAAHVAPLLGSIRESLAGGTATAPPPLFTIALGSAAADRAAELAASVLTVSAAVAVLDLPAPSAAWAAAPPTVDAAVIEQLLPRNLAEALLQSDEGRRAAALPPMQCRPPGAMAPPPPALWVAFPASMDRSMRAAVHARGFAPHWAARRSSRGTPRLVMTPWPAAAVLDIGAAAATAPWLLSDAAGRVAVDTMCALGIVDGAEEAGGGSFQLPGDLDASHVIADAEISLLRAVVFDATPGGPGQRRGPLFFAADDGSALAPRGGGRRLRFERHLRQCENSVTGVSIARAVTDGTVPEVACAVAAASRSAVNDLLRSLVAELRGELWRDAPWTAMTGWLRSSAASP